MDKFVRPSARLSDHRGHDYWWSHALSRRQFLGTTAGVAGAMATTPLWFPSLALAEDGVATVAPRPIPGGITVQIGTLSFPIHHFPPTPVLGPTVINEPSQITDFKGLVGITRVTGTGTGTDTGTNLKTPLSFRVDNGFMSGKYVGEDGHVHRGTFAFV